ncbi:hypothetical protein TNIN_411191 [Trichonephila inaurata madagascariensis]|uniref:Uncharacterized protein n=1 Tax=Trichonephila inaurata madagascariensis TaxID=2747483 RepID=A0A8X7CM07_9ARAC|nr:hypothetical protein TNIN_411191 [Trichonephila inaurata madagascariensis]
MLKSKSFQLHSSRRHHPKSINHFPQTPTVSNYQSPQTKITTSVSNNHDVKRAQLHAVRFRHPVKAINERRSCRHRQTGLKVERREDRGRANWHLSEDAYLRYKSPLDHPNYQWLASGRHQT